MRDCPNCHISMVKVPGGGFYYCKKCGRRIFEVERRADDHVRVEEDDAQSERH